MIPTGTLLVEARVELTGHVSTGDLLALALAVLPVAVGVWLVLRTSRSPTPESGRSPARGVLWRYLLAGAGGLLIVAGTLIGSSALGSIVNDLIRVTG
jgi:hypothetical protein